MHPNADQLMRRVEGSTMIRHNGLGENKLLMAAELPRDRQGRYHDGMQNGAPVGVVNTVLKYVMVMSDDIFVILSKGGKNNSSITWKWYMKASRGSGIGESIFFPPL